MPAAAPDLCRTCGKEPPVGLPSFPDCKTCLLTGKRARVAANNRALRARKAKAKADATADLNRAGKLTPTRRLLGILAILREHRGPNRPAVLTETVRKRLGYPDGQAGDRSFSRDLAVLESRGLVERCVTDDHLADNRNGLWLIEDIKPEIYELTPDEHDAIAQARRALRPGPLANALPDGPPSSQAKSLDLHLRLLRAVEEHHDELTVDELQTLLGVDRRTVVQVLRTVDDLRDTGHAVGLTVVYTDDSDDLDDNAQERGDGIAGVMLVRPDRRRRNPMLGLGLDELGRFAYTWHECDDRLGLIRAALTTWVPEHAPHLRDTLENAKTKLNNWQHMLPEPAAMRADEAS